MAKSMKKMLLLAAVQTGLGVDAAPTEAANAVLCRALMPELISGEQVERNPPTSTATRRLHSSACRTPRWSK